MNIEVNEDYIPTSQTGGFDQLERSDYKFITSFKDKMKYGNANFRNLGTWTKSRITEIIQTYQDANEETKDLVRSLLMQPITDQLDDSIKELIKQKYSVQVEDMNSNYSYGATIPNSLPPPGISEINSANGSANRTIPPGMSEMNSTNSTTNSTTNNTIPYGKESMGGRRRKSHRRKSHRRKSHRRKSHRRN